MAYPILWVPASSEDFSRGRAASPILAIVHHRMVGTLPGTDRTFQSTSNRPVSTHFGIGYENGRLEIHQYVDLSDTAFGNGNYDSSGSWDNWGYPTSNINARTVSIEHQDNAQLDRGDGKGIVPEAVIRASLWLDSLLLSGDVSKMRAAGIRVRSSTTASQLGRIKPGSRTLITHNDIAGRLKPYCWKPWADDGVGYPRSRYVTTLSSGDIPLPDTSTEDFMEQFQTYTTSRVVDVHEGAVLYDNEHLAPSEDNIIIKPGRTMPYLGTTSINDYMVAYIPASNVGVTTKSYWVKRDQTSYPRLASAGISQADVDSAVKKATDPLKATIASLNERVAALTEKVAQLTVERDNALSEKAAALLASEKATVFIEALRALLP